nr:hypothetical protein [Sicyoidochytrium minutum DNA virus]
MPKQRGLAQVMKARQSSIQSSSGPATGKTKETYVSKFYTGPTKKGAKAETLKKPATAQPVEKGKEVQVKQAPAPEPKTKTKEEPYVDIEKERAETLDSAYNDVYNTPTALQWFYIFVSFIASGISIALIVLLFTRNPNICKGISTKYIGSSDGYLTERVGQPNSLRSFLYHTELNDAGWDGLSNPRATGLYIPYAQANATAFLDGWLPKFEETYPSCTRTLKTNPGAGIDVVYDFLKDHNGRINQSIVYIALDTDTMVNTDIYAPLMTSKEITLGDGQKVSAQGVGFFFYGPLLPVGVTCETNVEAVRLTWTEPGGSAITLDAIQYETSFCPK